MIDEDSAGFVEAFTAAVRPGEPRARPARLMLMVALAAAFAVTLGSLLDGAFGSAGASGGQPALGLGAAATVSGSGAPTPGPAVWTAVAGPTCTGSAASFTETGYRDAGAEPAAGWGSSAVGGYVGSGCAGGFVALPLSGDADAFDSGRYAVWTFDLGAGFAAHSACNLATYVPNGSDPSLVGGAPAYYFYYAAVYRNGAAPLGDYAVDQREDHGSWVPDASFTATGRDVSVRLVDAGANQGSASPGPRAAAAQVRLSCAAT